MSSGAILSNYQRLRVENVCVVACRIRASATLWCIAGYVLPNSPCPDKRARDCVPAFWCRSDVRDWD